MKQLVDFIHENWKNTIRFNQENEGNLIGLPKPYTVPSIEGHFQELYYWDTYFTNVGLILSNRLDLAKNNTENIAFMINKYGYMPNGNRTYYLTRSQPPFFTLMVREIYEIEGDKDWLKEMYAAGVKEYDFWMNNRITDSGLCRYYGTIDEDMVSQRSHNFCKRIKIDCPEDYESQFKIVENALAVCESGWDCNSRFGLRNQEYNWVDLNALLFGMEENLAFFANELGLESDWQKKADDRKALMNKLCWNEAFGMFADYNFVEKKMSDFVSCASAYAMFTGLCTETQAAKTVKLLEKLEQTYGVAACEKRDDLMDLQWDYPHGWACLHHIIISGLKRYGYNEDAKRIAKKYCDTVERNFLKTNNVWEKYNVVTGEVSVTKENMIPASMMGWSAGIYLYGLSQLEK